jgi:ArsR family transcriptional regulator
MKTISDPNRLRILLSLMNKELCICQLMGILDLSQSLISKHMSILFKVDLVRSRKQGKLAYYSMNKDIPKSWTKILNTLSEILKEDEQVTYDQKSLNLCFEALKDQTEPCSMDALNKFQKKKKKIIGKR